MYQPVDLRFLFIGLRRWVGSLVLRILATKLMNERCSIEEVFGMGKCSIKFYHWVMLILEESAVFGKPIVFAPNRLTQFSERRGGFLLGEFLIEDDGFSEPKVRQSSSTGSILHRGVSYYSDSG